MVVLLVQRSRFFSCSQSESSCRETIIVQVSFMRDGASSIVVCPLRVSKASGNDSKRSLISPLAPRVLTGTSVFFLPDECNRAAASNEIKHF